MRNLTSSWEIKEGMNQTGLGNESIEGGGGVAFEWSGLLVEPPFEP